MSVIKAIVSSRFGIVAAAVVGAVCLFSAPNAHAATLVLTGDVPNTTNPLGVNLTTGGGSFTQLKDQFYFEVTGSGSVPTYEYGAFAGLTGVSTTLKGIAGNTFAATTIHLASTGGYTVLPYTFLGNLAAGYYSLLLTGHTGSAFGAASIGVVPVPGALPMFGAGLAGLVFFARRRRVTMSVA